MRVVVTGASGFIGRPVIARLRAQGAHVVALTHQRGVDSAQSRALDLFDADARLATLREIRPTHLVHLAWTTQHGRYWSDPANRDWTAMSLDLLRDFATVDGEHVFIAGSCAEYDWHTDGPLDGRHTPLRPHTLYGQCKAELFQRATALARTLGFALAWGRISFPYGPGEHPQRLVPSLARSLLAGRVAECGPATVARDFIAIDDVADGVDQLVAKRREGAFDLCSGVATEVGVIATRLADLIGRRDLLRLGALPARPGDPLRLECSGATMRAIGWRPRVSLELGLRRSVAWWKACQRTDAVVAHA